MLTTVAATQVSVIGSGAEWEAAAEEVGRLLAARGSTVVTGGLGEVMAAAQRGAKAAGGPWSIPIGAVLFYFSDISVASGQFVKPDFPNYVWGLPFYFIGQAFLAWSTQPAASATTNATRAAASPA